MPRVALIAVDADDVLVAHFEVLFEHLNARFGSDVSGADWHARYLDIGEYARDWGVPVDDVVDSVHDRLVSDDAFAEPLPGAMEALQALQRTHRLVVVSARHQLLGEATHAWLDAHLPGVFEDVVLLGADRWGDGLRVGKVDTLQELGASVLVDDSLSHCAAAADAGLRAILFGDYDWNRADALPEGVVRATGWPDVQRLLS